MKKISLLFWSLVFLVSIRLPDALAKDYARVVSLVPSVTEIIYAVGSQDKLVGVTRYCSYPPQAQEKTKVGGLLDVNYEVLWGLKPDLAILQVDESAQIEKINAMGIETLKVETRNIAGILKSIRDVGQAVGKAAESEQLASQIEQECKDVRSKTEKLSHPRVLVTFLRQVGEGTIQEVYIAGNHTYYDELITIAGGVNAYQGPEMITSPILSPEGILRLNPDIIIEVMSSDLEAKFSEETIIKDWQMLPQLDAFKNKQIHILKNPYLGIPGPRIGQTVMALARIIHPEVDWK